MAVEITEKSQLASQFVNSTNRHVFLTGKAGTGKTTFLKEFAQNTHKSHVIVAPTGVAALNANGTTIHSQFLLPLGAFVPGQNAPAEFESHAQFFTQTTLARRNPLNAKRKEVLRNLDLLIIDEVSMLRADILDAVDYRLKAAKRNFNQPFGGVQLLMIGDMHQLPPILRDQERAVLRSYYGSAHFFESQALRQSGMVFIELDKVFRQQNETFIRILNNLRDNKISPADIEELNKRFDPNAEAEDDVVTLTTHNKTADEINQNKLNALQSKEHMFAADVEDDFPERIYPVPERLILKEGAQIMFVKNDTRDGMYYNGKLAKVTEIGEDGVFVRFNDDGETYELREEVW
ncbi:MAG: AAA family ATPase, partial [Flavobacteriales bacterium]|nr:AAA family ATPase [Flavobacteriales bacterium]